MLEGAGAKVQCRMCHGTTWGNQRELDRWERDRVDFELLNPDLDYSKVKPKPFPQGDCAACNGTGERELASGVPDTSYLGDGSGLSARPTGSSMHGALRGAPEGTILDVAQASRIMMRVERRSVTHWRALQAYHGDVGEYAHGQHGNRLLAVLLLVDGGHRVLEAERERVDRAATKRAEKRKRKRARDSSREEPPPSQDIAAIDLPLSHMLRACSKGWIRQVAKLAPSPPAAAAMTAKEALAVLHNVSTRTDERRALYAAASVEAYALLLSASRTWEACLGRRAA